jgi:hypothetical protein
MKFAGGFDLVRVELVLFKSLVVAKLIREWI